MSVQFTVEEIERMISESFPPIPSAIDGLAEVTLDSYKNNVRLKLSRQSFNTRFEKEYAMNNLPRRIRAQHYKSLVPDGTRVCRPPTEDIGAASSQTSLDMKKNWATNSTSKPVNDLLSSILTGSKPREVSMVIRFYNPLTREQAQDYSLLIENITGADVYVDYDILNTGTAGVKGYDWWDPYGSGVLFKSTFLRITIDTYRLYLSRIHPHTIVDKLVRKVGQTIKNKDSKDESSIIVHCSPSVVRVRRDVMTDQGIVSRVRRCCYLDVFAKSSVEEYGGDLLSKRKKEETFFKDQVVADFKTLPIGGIPRLTNCQAQSTPYMSLFTSVKSVAELNPDVFGLRHSTLNTYYMELNDSIVKNMGLSKRLGFIMDLLGSVKHKLLDIEIEPDVQLIYGLSYIVIYTNDTDPLKTIRDILVEENRADNNFVTATGTNLIDVALIPGIDISNCISSSVNEKVGEVLPTFGIENTVTGMLRGLDATLKRVGSRLNTVSLIEIVNLLTLPGIPLGVRYHKIIGIYPIESSAQSEGAHMHAKATYASASLGSTEVAESGSHMIQIAYGIRAHQESWRTKVTLASSAEAVGKTITNVASSLASRNGNPKPYYAPGSVEDPSVPTDSTGRTILSVPPLLLQIAERDYSLSNAINRRTNISTPTTIQDIPLGPIPRISGIRLNIASEPRIDSEIEALRNI